MRQFLLSKKQKELYGEKLVDLAHIAIGGLLFGQFVSNQPFSMRLATYGLISLIVLYGASYLLTRERK